jgi:hypothetical protein
MEIRVWEGDALKWRDYGVKSVGGICVEVERLWS